MKTKIISLSPFYSQFRFRIDENGLSIQASEEVNAPFRLSYINLNGFCLLVTDNARNALNIINFIHAKAKAEKSPLLKDFWRSLVNDPNNMIIGGSHVSNSNNYQLTASHIDEDGNHFFSNLKGFRNSNQPFIFLDTISHNGIYYLKGRNLDEDTSILLRGIIKCLEGYDPAVTYPKQNPY